MGEHYPEHAIGELVSHWCNRCGGYTQHKIVRHSEHAGRVGHCVACKVSELTQKQKQQQVKEAGERRQPRLF